MLILAFICLTLFCACFCYGPRACNGMNEIRCTHAESRAVRVLSHNEGSFSFSSIIRSAYYSLLILTIQASPNSSYSRILTA